MQIQTLSPTPTTAKTQDTRSQQQAQTGQTGAPASHASPQAQQQAKLNSAIMSSALDASISAKNEPQALLYRSAIESLNEVLAEDFGANAIGKAMGQDNSPEATADRIVSLSTGFFEAFKKNHPDKDEQEVLDLFMHTIRTGFETGFREAQDILSGLGALEGEVASGINKTFDLVMQGFADFAQAHTPKQG